MNNNDPKKDDAQFENPDVDPGFSGKQHNEELEGEEDERSHNIDANTSIKEMREGKEKAPDSTSGDDALNYKNDHEHGAFNPKNI